MPSAASTIYIVVEMDQIYIFLFQSTTKFLEAETGFMFLMTSQNVAVFLQRTSPWSLEQKSRKTYWMRVQLIQEASRFHVDQGGSAAWGISWL